MLSLGRTLSATPVQWRLAARLMVGWSRMPGIVDRPALARPATQSHRRLTPRSLTTGTSSSIALHPTQPPRLTTTPYWHSTGPSMGLNRIHRTHRIHRITIALKSRSTSPRLTCICPVLAHTCPYSPNTSLHSSTVLYTTAILCSISLTKHSYRSSHQPLLCSRPTRTIGTPDSALLLYSPCYLILNPSTFPYRVSSKTLLPSYRSTTVHKVWISLLPSYPKTPPVPLLPNIPPLQHNTVARKVPDRRQGPPRQDPVSHLMLGIPRSFLNCIYWVVQALPPLVRETSTTLSMSRH